MRGKLDRKNWPQNHTILGTVFSKATSLSPFTPHSLSSSFLPSLDEMHEMEKEIKKKEGGNEKNENEKENGNEKEKENETKKGNEKKKGDKKKGENKKKTEKKDSGGAASSNTKEVINALFDIYNRSLFHSIFPSRSLQSTSLLFLASDNQSFVGLFSFLFLFV